MPPFCSTVAEHLHWPASVAHVAVVQPAAVKTLEILEHSAGVDETVRHSADNGKVIEPVVVVMSEYDPLALAVHDPVTFSEPVAGIFAHPR